MIEILLTGIPPSANNAYFNLPKGGRTLTKEGRKYLTETKITLAQSFPTQMQQFKANAPYAMLIRFYLKHLENAGFKTGMTATRYKKIDISNRVKLLEDALKDAGGIDDSQNIILLLEKVQSGNDTEYTHIFAWNLGQEASPFDAVRTAVPHFVSYRAGSV